MPLELLLDEIPNISEGREPSRVLQSPGKAVFMAALLHGSTVSTGVGQRGFWSSGLQSGSWEGRVRQRLPGLCVCGPLCAEGNPELLRDGELTSEKEFNGVFG